jgi:VanZ family protein
MPADAPFVSITRAAFTAVLLALGGLAYGSLLPFDLHWPTSPTALLTAPQWHDSVTFDDLVTNLVLYLPVAAVLGFALRRCGMRWWWRLPLGLIVFASVVWLLECLQSLSPHRFASLNDWTCNTFGATVGLAGSPVIEWCLRHALGLMRRGLARLTQSMVFDRVVRSRRSYAVGLAVGLLGMVALYIRSAMPHRLAAPTTAQVNLVPMLHEFMMPYLSAARVLGRDVAFYAALGVMAWACLQLAGLHTAARWSAVGVMALAGVAEASQLFDASRFPDVTQPLLAVGSAAASVFVAQLVISPVLSHRRLAHASPA